MEVNCNVKCKLQSF